MASQKQADSQLQELSVVAIPRASLGVGLSGAGVLLLGFVAALRRVAASDFSGSTAVLFVGGALIVAGLFTLRRASKRAWLGAMAKLVVILVATLVGVALCEVGLRVYLRARHLDIRLFQPSYLEYISEQRAQHYNETYFDRRRFISHPFLPYIARPYDSRSLRYFRPGVNRIVTYDYHNNSLGFRTPERPYQKPLLAKRVVTLGGSTTWDGPTNDETWPALLEQKLNSYYGRTGHKIEVVNMAVDGWVSAESLVSLALLGVQFEPDLVISYDGANDIGTIGLGGLMPDYRTIFSHYDDRVQTLQARLPPFVFRSYLVSQLTRIYDVHSHVTPYVNDQVWAKMSTLPRSPDPLVGIEYFERNLRLMRAISAAYGSKFIASCAHWVHPDQNATWMNEHLREFFRREQMPYLDVDRLLPHDDYSIHVDHIHWTREGLDRVAELWLRAIIAQDLLGLNGELAGKDEAPARS